MRLLRTKPFLKEYKKLSPILQNKVHRQISHLATDMRHPALYAKKMVNQDDIWEARIDEHYRMTFQIYNDIIILRRVGTHEIYRKP